MFFRLTVTKTFVIWIMQLTIQTPTADLNQSIVFYKKLGFEIQTQGNKIVAIDSQICIEINPKRTAWVCIQLYQSRWVKRYYNLKTAHQ